MIPCFRGFGPSKRYIDDPKIFSKPWSREFEILAKPDWESAGLYEYVCEKNNRCPVRQVRRE